VCEEEEEEEDVNQSWVTPMMGEKGWLWREISNPNETRGVSHYGLAIHIKKYLKAKEEELWKFKYFTMQKYNLQKKNPLKETKILQDIITL